MATLSLARFRNGIVFFLCLYALCGFSKQAIAAAAPKTGTPTRVISEKMTYDAVKQIVIFEGKVHVTRLDMQLWADKLTMHMDESGKKTSRSNAMGMGTGKVERIVAENNVRIEQGDKRGSCGRATYYMDRGKVVMEQNPVVHDGPNQIRGRVINYFTESGHSEVLGNVDVRIITDDDKATGPGAILGGPR